MAFSGVGGRQLRATRAPLPGTTKPNFAGEPTMRPSLVRRFRRGSTTMAADALRSLAAHAEADRVTRQMYHSRGQLDAWFTTVDDNGDCVLTTDELAAGLREGFGVSDANAAAVAAVIVRRADDDRDGTLSHLELLNMVRRAAEGFKTRREAADAAKKIAAAIFVYLPTVARPEKETRRQKEKAPDRERVGEERIPVSDAHLRSRSSGRWASAVCSRSPRTGRTSRGSGWR